MSAVGEPATPNIMIGDSVRINYSALSAEQKRILGTFTDPIGYVFNRVFDDYFDIQVACIEWPVGVKLAERWHPKFLTVVHR